MEWQHNFFSCFWSKGWVTVSEIFFFSLHTHLMEVFNGKREYNGFGESETIKLNIITLFFFIFKPFVLKCWKSN